MSALGKAELSVIPTTRNVQQRYTVILEDYPFMFSYRIHDDDFIIMYCNASIHIHTADVVKECIIYRRIRLFCHELLKFKI